ncbi:MAG: FAD-binding and (Fe-S)-binding domain-containing protein [Candidatus Methanoperedens sp.]|nr:FAD-binding and (Fe-S)-binding domain-containing protein [Candidatus Methanoperedens sp.]
MKTDQRSYLGEKFKNRVTFDHVERKLYGHDISAIPGMIKPLIGNTTPDAVVQPQTEEELIELVNWAQKQRIPLTPRGKATSGYGGAIPVKKGIVVDFYRMKNVLDVDKDKLIATVQPGISWEQLDRRLADVGLTLRLYPTSYPSSTVGGWLAQGGAGIGSYEYGYFGENVISARAVLPTGEVREFTDKDLALVSEAEGITGLITQVTLRVQPLEDVDVAAIACPDARDLQKLVNTIIDAKLPIWSMVFINPRMAEMKNRAPMMEHAGHPAEERVLLPAAYVLSLAFRKVDSDKIHSSLHEMIKSCEAEILSDRIAKHEWEHRFKLMVVKRLGPSLVPSEVIIPLSALGDVMGDIECKVDQPVVKEGVIIKNGTGGVPEVVILGFIPADQRRFSYNFVFGLVLTIMKIAESRGGRPYSTGLYFSKKADRILGKEKVERLRAYKSGIDPKGIMNPGKVIGNELLGIALHAAGAVEPLIRPFGNYVTTRIGERPEEKIRDIPEDVAWYAYSCSQCGYCIDECDQFYGRGWESQSPRGKWYWLREYMEGRVQWDQKMVDTFLVCTTCEMCDRRCSAALPVEPSWMKMRGKLVDEDKRMTFPPFVMMGEALRAEGDIWAGYRKDRAAWFPQDLLGKHGANHKSKNVYFAGCTASYVEKDIGMASVRLLDKAGVDFTYLGEKESCCATPMLAAGRWDIFAETMKKNIAAVKSAGADTVISSCPACDMMWRQVYPVWAKKLGVEYGIAAKHYTEIVSEKLKSGEFSFPDRAGKPVTVTWHDSCHIGRASGVYEPPRDVIKAIPNLKFVEMSHHHEKAHCCGSVLTLIKEPPVAADVGKIRLDEAVEAGAEKVLALCPCCQFQLRVSRDKKNVPVDVVDLARFAATSLGYEFPDPNPDVQAQWAVFEAFVALMTPQGFADLLGTMWPELIDAMPFGMGKMMRVMGKVPGALTLMKPMFPALFPVLLPMMMPKLMPTMLSRVKASIPMPGYMAEQMPELMPKVMDNLMPHMIKDVVPLVTQPMIDYLGKR